MTHFHILLSLFFGFVLVRERYMEIVADEAQLAAAITKRFISNLVKLRKKVNKTKMRINIYNRLRDDLYILKKY